MHGSVRVFAAAVALALLASSAGCTRRATQLLVVVDGDLRGTEIGCVDVEVQRVEEPERRTTQRFHVSAALEPRVVLPFSLGVTAPDGRPERRVSIRAAAFAAEGDGCAATPSVSRTIRTGFLAEQTLRLPIYLARACLGVSCADDQTCDGGECVLVPDVDPGSLAVVRPGEEIPDAGAPPDAAVHEPFELVRGPEPTPGDLLGDSVALSADGTTLAIGARDESSGGRGIDPPRDGSVLASGAVLVYTRSGAGWALEAFVKAPNAGELDRFGTSVALSDAGDVLAVGAPREDGGARGVGGSLEDDSAFDSGAVYVYRRTAGTWAFEAYVKASNPGTRHAFGQSLALSADASVLVVGAPGEPSSIGGIDPPGADGATPGAGAAYLYAFVGSAWRFEAHVKAPTPGVGDQLGFCVAVSGDGETVALGARQEESSGAGIDPPHDDLLPDSGAVYVLRRVGGTWAYEATLKASVPGLQDLFGHAIALSDDGDVLAVGAIREDTGMGGVGAVPDEAVLDAGAVYVLQRAGSTWSMGAFLKPAIPATTEHFGYAVALSGAGDRLAVSTWPAATTPFVASFSHEGALWRAGATTPVATVGTTTPPLPVALALSDDGRILAVGVPDGDGAGVVEVHADW